MVFSVWLQHFVFIPNVINLFQGLSLFSIGLFFFRRENRYLKTIPVKTSLILMFVSLIVSNYYSYIRHDFLVISTCVVLFNLVIFWCLIRSNPLFYLKLFVKYSFVFACIISFYGLFETLTNSNPFIELINSLNLYINDYLVTEIRFGIKRGQSIFAMHTTNGGISLVLACLLLYIKMNTKYFAGNSLVKYVIVLLFATTFFSGARSVMLGCIVCSLMFFSKTLLKVKYLLLVLLVLCVGFVLLNDYFVGIYESFVDTEKVSGSSTSMREGQFEIALIFLEKSFWIGNGLAYTWEYVQNNFKELYGAESMWIPVMIDQGILGVIALVLYLLSCVYYVFKQRQYRLVFFVLGFVLFNTMSSIPNFPITYIYMYLVVMSESRRYFN